MPIPMPSRALPIAYRVICMRAIRALACSKSEIEYRFILERSKKCAYCTLINKKCYLVLLYIG